MAALIMLYDPIKSITQANNTIHRPRRANGFEILDNPDLREQA